MFQLELEIVLGSEITRQSFTLKEGGKILVGRLECDLLLTHRSVSRKHLGFAVRGGKLIAGDLKSTSGTLKNGAPMKQAHAGRGDLFQVGVYQLRLRKFSAIAETAPRRRLAWPNLSRWMKPQFLGAAAALMLVMAGTLMYFTRKPEPDRGPNSLPLPSYSYEARPTRADLAAREAGL